MEKEGNWFRNRKMFHSFTYRYGDYKHLLIDHPHNISFPLIYDYFHYCNVSIRTL